MEVINVFPAIGPYMGVTMDKKITIKNGRKARNFRVIVYAAFNAYGLIGSEKNGIAILDEDNRQVLADEIEKESSGYFGPSQNQLSRFNEIRAFSWPEFREFVNSCGRNRYDI